MIRKCFYSLLVVLLVSVMGCQVNPVTGEKQLRLVSAEKELAMGHSYHPDLIPMYDGEYQDAKLKRYLGTIVQRLHKVSHRPEMPIDFTVLNTTMLNAFAIPGHVYATRGFLAELDNEAQFAAVMGHELAHVTAGHSAQNMSSQMITSVGLGVLGSFADESTASQAVLMGSQLGISLLGFSYSRQHEHQADRVGTYYMALAGWDPRQSIRMQEILGSFHEGKPSFLDKYLSTHPPTEERVLDIQNVIDEKSMLNAGLIQGDGIYAKRWKGRMTKLKQVNSAFEHYDVGTKLFGEEKYQEALDAAKKATKMNPHQAQFYRLQGDALAQLGNYKVAKTAYQAALKKDPRYVLANIGLGEIALEKDNYGDAEEQFALATHAYPGSVMAHYGLGVTRFQMKKYKEAIAPLAAVAQAAPTAASVHFLLGTAYYKTEQWQPSHDAYQRALANELKDEDYKATAETRVQELIKKLGLDKEEDTENKEEAK
jgi:beta-barrel assembly-enhancing protease